MARITHNGYDLPDGNEIPDVPGDLLRLVDSGPLAVANYGEIGYAKLTSGNPSITTTPTDVLALTVTHIADRACRLSTSCTFFKNPPDTAAPCVLQLTDNVGTVIQSRNVDVGAPGQNSLAIEHRLIPVAGVHTYRVRAYTSAGFVNVFGLPTNYAWFAIDDIGPWPRP